MKSAFLIGLLVIGGALFFAVTKYGAFQVEKYGEIVRMRIDHLPASCDGRRTKHYMTLHYDNDIFSKKIPAGYCNQHRVGELIEMKYLKEKEAVLFPNETIVGEFIAIGIFLAAGVLLVVLSFFENKKFNPWLSA